MVSMLKPIEAVNCPSLKRLVAVTDCEDCVCCLEIRSPWRHFVVKCSVDDKGEAVYP